MPLPRPVLPKVTLRRAVTVFCCALLACGGWAGAQSAAAKKLRIVGGLAGLNPYTQHEEPFWTQALARLSAGKFEADIVPIDRAGVPAGDMLRLMQLGVVPFGTTLLSSLSAQYPEFSAPDLAGLNPDMATLKKTVAAFRPYLENELRLHHGVEVLAIYAYPAQVIFCKKAMTGLADLAGRRIRVASATQSDFVSGLGARPVLIADIHILSSLASGNSDCAITGAMTGNTLGLHEVTSHLHSLPVTWGIAVFGANLAAWGALPPDLRALLSRELPRLEATIWRESERETTEGLACNRGAAPCSDQRRGHMVQIDTNPPDEQRRQKIFITSVLAHWLQRCPTRCVEVWNQTIGPARAILLPVPQ